MTRALETVDDTANQNTLRTRRPPHSKALCAQAGNTTGAEHAPRKDTEWPAGGSSAPMASAV